MANLSKCALISRLAPAVVLLLAGCAGDHDAKPGVYAANSIAELEQTKFSDTRPVEYHLEPNDAVSIKVYGEPDMSAERVTLDQSGVVNINFIGPVHAAGLTTEQLSGVLREKLLTQLRSPQVAVNLVEYGSQKVTVEGSVPRPGIFEVNPGTTLLGVLATAGDPDRFARVRKIVIFRNDEAGRTVALFDLHEIRDGKMIDPVVKGNDRIVVGVSGTSRFYQDLISLIPAAAIFSRY